MKVITMGNNIITLPIKGAACKPSPINQFQTDMDTLSYIADGILDDDLIADTNADGAAGENWRRYRQIARMIFAANAMGWDLRQIRYRKAPDRRENVATIVITIQKDRSFPNEARTALAAASMLADNITISTDDGDVQISFKVYDIL